MKKKVLITGAAGFLGSHLCDRFIHEGFQVVAMDNLITGSLKNNSFHFFMKFIFCRLKNKQTACGIPLF